MKNYTLKVNVIGEKETLGPRPQYRFYIDGCERCLPASVFEKYTKEINQVRTGNSFSKKLISDIRYLLWVVTVGGLLLAWYCVRTGYMGGLPWVSAMTGLPWAAHGVVCSFYLNMAKSDHQEGGITYESAKASGFNTPTI